MPKAELFVDWVIVGGGVAGLTSALALRGDIGGQAITEDPVVVVEKAAVGQGASTTNPGFFHGGFEYFDRTTSAQLQDLLAYNLTDHRRIVWPSLRRGRSGLDRNCYAVLPDRRSSTGGPLSIVPNATTFAHFEWLAARWDKLRNHNEELRLLGDGPFMRWLNSTEINSLFGPAPYERVAGTLEPSIDVVAFLNDLKLAVKNHDVSIFEQTRVDRISRLDRRVDGARFLVSATRNGERFTLLARNVNCCAWDGTESLLAPLGYKFDTINRIKRAFVVNLAPESHRYPTCMVVSGPHATLGNLGTGKAFLTLGELSNLNTHRLDNADLVLDEYRKKRFEADSSALDGFVRDSVATYFPGLHIEGLADIVYGVVKVQSRSERINLNDPLSSHHTRRAKGLTLSLGAGLWVTWAMKLTSCLWVAEQFHKSLSSNQALSQ